MSISSLETDYTNVISSFDECYTPITSSYTKALERYADLERRWLVQKQKSMLLPIEDRHKIFFEYCQSSEDR